jgi:hypothetical protein
MRFWPFVSVYGLALLFLCLLSFWMPKRPLRLAIRVVTGALLIPLLLVCALIVLVFALQPPGLATLARKFPSRQADLETILRMSDEDMHDSRIAPDFLWRDAYESTAAGQFYYPDPKSGLTKSRWDQYRVIYGRNGIKLGILRDKERDAFIMIDSIGLLNRGHTTGYLYCSSDSSKDEDRFEPCTLNLERGSRAFDPVKREEAYSFQRLNARWLVFDQGPS